MSIELNDKSYIVGTWFSSNPLTNNNWLASIIKDPENPNLFKGISRFRYLRDKKIFNSEDKKSWYNITFKELSTEDEVIDSMDSIQKAIESEYPKYDRIIVKGDLKKFIELSKNKDWMHIKQERMD